MRMEAAVLEGEGGEFEIQEVEIEEPRKNEVLVRVVGAGVCHTDMIVRDQMYPTPLPAVLGHEGSGVVEEVGCSVDEFTPGDRVVMSFDSDGVCGSCRSGSPAYCDEFFAYNFGGYRPEDGSSPITRRGEEISGRFFGQSSFATKSIASSRNLVKVDDDVPLELLGPLGCGVQTGAGAVLNSLEVEAGSSIAVFGCGSVGLSSVMAANIAGAGEILAVEPNRDRREKAAELGATSSIDPGSVDDISGEVKEISGGGMDYAVETTSLPGVARTATDSLGKTGVLGVIGAPELGTEATYDVNELILNGRSIRGIVEGDSNPKTFIPKLIDMYRRGSFPFNELVEYYDFHEIQKAVDDSENNDVIKPILKISDP